ncbi:MAG TPA: type IV pilus secretin PilQ [Marinospirillum sp.]|uniref:type IV pilus secretin PilQ n=1 Tax=Marinospirillum sp. TaxID=2183934 RepID=UPI002B498513|nr:type IV pilus secretin PilQ [Marinospirillum sp.]HKM16554.1 type IV pilus secretin PilQ [Marinospirillum sp.]
MTANLHTHTQYWLVTLLLIGVFMPFIAWANSTLTNSTQLIGIDFRLTPQGNALIIIDFSTVPTLPNTKQLANGLHLKFAATNINHNLINLYDSSDFATQVKQLELLQTGTMAELIMQINGEFSYQLNTNGQQLQIEIANKLRQQTTVDTQPNEDERYTGELISLNYHDIPLRSLLAELAAFLGLNLMTDDSITGNATLHLDSIPSDQALAILLASQGLASRQQGNVLLVAPVEKLIRLEQQQKSTLQLLNTRPLEEAFIKISYSDAKAIQGFILGDQQPVQAQQKEINIQNTQRFLSDQGHLLVDDRTNTLYVRDTAEQVERIKDIVDILDVPVDQVMIEARIVVASTGVGEQLGIRWGMRNSPTKGASQFETTQVNTNGNLLNANMLSSNQGTSLDFNPVTGFNFGFISNNLLLDLELAALESENRSEVISQPRVITSNRNKAVIRSGEEIPYTSIDKDGVRTTEFRQAELRLEVTPQIVNDGRIFLTLQVNNDSKGEETANAGPTINTNAVDTQVLVNNGETIVIGGIFTSQKLEGEVKTPLLGDIPLIGWLFRRTFSEQKKVELLIFITPRMINNTLAKQ